MELLIRSQDKLMLIKANKIDIDQDYDEIYKKYVYDIRVNEVIAGSYKTEKRALEVLDEIQKLMANQYIVELKELVREKEAKLIEEYYKNNYSGEFILQPSAIEIHPINSNVIAYEMPKE